MIELIFSSSRSMRYSHTMKNFLSPKKQWLKDGLVKRTYYLLLLLRTRGVLKKIPVGLQLWHWVHHQVTDIYTESFYDQTKDERRNKCLKYRFGYRTYLTFCIKHKHITIVNWYFSFQCQCTACAQNWGLLEALPNGVSQTPGLSPTAKVKVCMTSLLLFQRVESNALCQEGHFSKWF